MDFSVCEEQLLSSVYTRWNMFCSVKPYLKLVRSVTLKNSQKNIHAWRKHQEEGEEGSDSQDTQTKQYQKDVGRS